MTLIIPFPASAIWPASKRTWQSSTSHSNHRKTRLQPSARIDESRWPRLFYTTFRLLWPAKPLLWTPWTRWDLSSDARKHSRFMMAGPWKTKKTRRERRVWSISTLLGGPMSTHTCGSRRVRTSRRISIICSISRAYKKWRCTMSSYTECSKMYGWGGLWRSLVAKRHACLWFFPETETQRFEQWQ